MKKAFERRKNMIQFSYSIAEGVIPKGLELILEPTIIDHDENVLCNLESKLKHYIH